MRIKRLEISGFKSFADKAVLDFQHGVTGVVGPNGCGKSNIVDAIRWCMGEQSVKNLRGKAMEDIIFAGSESRKPLGVAEVSLVFSTEDGRAPAKYLDFSEIQLTRRLYRDGESEYLINKTSCRLLDILELFMDTGVGTKAYSIIEQGKIGQILHSRPEERRLLIEEAAGVTKYKNRKQLALKKIDATQQNLLRLSDVLGEIRRQLNSLQRQARKAEKFREYRDELREIDLLAALQQAKTLQLSRHQAELQLGTLHQDLLEAAAAAELAETQVEQQRLQVLEAEKNLNNRQEELFTVRREAVICESGLQFRRKEIAGLDERYERSGAELAAVGAQRENCAGELEQLRGRQQMEGGALATAEMQLTALQEEQSGREQDFDTLNCRLEAQRRELFSAGGEAAQCRNRQEQARKRLDLVTERSGRQVQEHIQLTATLAANRDRATALKEALLQRQAEQQQIMIQVAACAEQEQLLKQHLPSLQQAVDQCRETLTRNRSRQVSLQELEAQFAGYGQGVRLLMTESPLKGRFKGLLADALQVPEAYEAAVEAVLAERLQTVICGNEEDLCAAIAYLQGQQSGRAQLALEQHESPQLVRLAGATPLLELLEETTAALPLVRRMLATVHLVDSRDTALALGRRFPDQTFVTTDGTVVSPDGTISSGATEQMQSGIIHKKRELRLLDKTIRQMTAELADREAERDRVDNGLQEVGDLLQAALQQRHRLELLLTGLQKDMQQLEAEDRRLGERATVLEHECQLLQEERAALEAELTAAALGQQAAEASAARLEQETAMCVAELEGKRLLLAAAREALTTQRVAVATLREQREAHLRTIAEHTIRLQELDQRITTVQQDKETIAVARQVLHEETAAEGKRLHGLLEEQQRLEQQLLAARQQYEAASAQLGSEEQAVRQRRDERDGLRQRHAELSLVLSSLSLQLEHLEQSLQDRHRLGLADVRGRLGDRPFDEVTAQIRRVDLERLVDELGEVNLMAIEEYAGMEQRYNFLAAQKTDLEESLHDLQQAIQRINRTTRKRFQETFQKVNEKFQEVFPRLFCGGRAELKLTDEQDLLETGIEIVVQPPGKKLSNVMLLSGGEKALTAVALIFSIFLIKPTPFCLLDEVDAPLDDANIGRFNEMVREMSAVSQFIIITHNKTTMGVADALYGITMEEPGASRLVSVRLH